MRALSQAISTGLAMLAVLAPTSGAQVTLPASTPFHATSGGRTLATIRAGASVTPVAGQKPGAETQVVLEGFLDAGLAGPARDSFPMSVKGTNTVYLRTSADRTSAIKAELHGGMGLVIVAKQTGWVQVRRTGWVPTSALKRPADPPRVVTKAAPAPAPAPAPPPAPISRPVASPVAPSVASSAAQPSDSNALKPLRPVTLRDAPDGTALASITGGVAIPLARDRGWVRVRIEGWVPEADMTPADTSFGGSLTVADLRADPDGTKGRLVRWVVDLYALETADALRKDLNPDEQYFLARGPGANNSLLYLAVPPSLVPQARAINTPARALVTARVRTGRSDPIGVPILDVQSIVLQ